MTNVIYKYPILTIDEQEIELPKGSIILTVQIQNDTICLWAMVNPKIKKTEPRVIQTFGTGFHINDPGKYIGTYQIELTGGMFVGHVFEKIKPK